MFIKFVFCSISVLFFCCCICCCYDFSFTVYRGVKFCCFWCFFSDYHFNATVWMRWDTVIKWGQRDSSTLKYSSPLSSATSLRGCLAELYNTTNKPNFTTIIQAAGCMRLSVHSQTDKNEPARMNGTYKAANQMSYTQTNAKEEWVSIESACVCLLLWFGWKCTGRPTWFKERTKRKHNEKL